MIRVRGTLAGEAAELRWSAGALDGDRAAVVAAMLLADAGTPVRMAGIIEGPAGLAEPELARATMLAVLEAPEIVDDTEPYPDPPPAGAIA